MYSLKLLYALLLHSCLFSIVVHGRSVKNDAQVKKEKSWTYYVQDYGRGLLMAKHHEGKLKNCYAFGDEYVTTLALQGATASNIVHVDGKKMSSLLDLCTYNVSNLEFLDSDLEIVNLVGDASSWLIIPGTKWCGPGDVAKDDDDLGTARETDKCCRAHDKCDDHIEKFGSKHGLQNKSPFTKSHCECDDKFHACLNNVNSKTSNLVGKIYFNVIRVECFKEEHPIIGCRKSKGFIRPRCVEYSLDTTRPPIWQWFDAKEYEPKSEDRAELDYRKYALFEYALQSAAM